MIVFGSQRGYGQDLATHLLNDHDNDYVGVLSVDGTMAEDVHGAIEEWGFLAKSQTNCENYLYSLSVNSDPNQRPLSEDALDDFVSRLETSLGLAGQPRLMVQHIKEGKDGLAREHYHVVWSRIDALAGKAIPIPYDKYKTMAVTREFALDYGIELAKGYYQKGHGKQLSLYEKAQYEATGISKEERMALITSLWRGSDTPHALVSALDDHGYILATGKRPYVLVDIDGGMNSLPKMIDDKSVNTKEVRAFLDQDFPEEELPSVDEALEQIKHHKDAMKKLDVSLKLEEKLKDLQRSQEVRRARLLEEIEREKHRQAAREGALNEAQDNEHRQLRERQAGELLDVQFERAAREPKGLAGFLAKVSGVTFIRSKLHMREDKIREERFSQEKEQQRLAHEQDRSALEDRRKLETLDQERRVKDQQLIFEREKRSLKLERRREQSIRYRRTLQPAPAPGLALTPSGRMAVPHKAKHRYHMQTAKEANVKAPSAQTGAHRPCSKAQGRAQNKTLSESFNKVAPEPQKPNLDRDFEVKDRNPGLDRER